MNLYFECNSGISGDMSVAALLDLGADRQKLDNAFKSMNLNNEFTYNISTVNINAVRACDFNVILPENQHHKEHHHEHRNLEDINKIIDNTDMTDNAKKLAKRIFEITAQAEAKVHGKEITEVHFHEVGAIDSIADIVGFSVLYDDLKPEKVYFSALTEGQGVIQCQHGLLNVPVPAVCEIAAKYKLPLKLTDNNGEMVTPTGAAIAAALYTGEKLPDELIIEKVGNGAGKRKYINPVLRVMMIKENI
ncbi:MAG: LarC family nickel insertion protein [Candidatus Gastranaerophilales bacterium]|nr:LarC family nickel insertion protein [Candidatus Gastranaerophilales bacterium]